MPRARHHWDPVCDPPRLVVPVPVDPQGQRGPTPSQARRAGTPRSAWRRTGPGLFVPAHVDPDVPEQRVLEAAMLLRGADAVTGWAALRMHGARFFDGRRPDGRGPLPVVLVAGPHHHRRGPRGLQVVWSQDRLRAEEVVVRQSVRVTRPDRATFDAARTAPDLQSARVTLDMSFAAGLTTIRRMDAYIQLHAGWNGVPLVRQALPLASERSRSPAESAVRYIWEVDAGLPRPLVNQEVFSRSGRLLGVADLLDVEAGLVVEFDGADHAGARRRSGDARRESGMRDHVLEVERVTGYDLHDRTALAHRLVAARRRARWLPAHARPWTVEPPAGWEAEPTLDERLDHLDFLRECDEAWAREHR